MKNLKPFKKVRPLLLTLTFLALALLALPATALAASKTVGNGTPGSCTEAAFNKALKNGGKILFKCGSKNKTITLTSTKTIAQATTIDGGGKITLTEKGHAHFSVNSSQKLTLQNITLKGGSGTNAGALENFGTTTLTQVKFINNTASVHGGAITNHFNLSVELSQFQGNSAGAAGGAIYNDGGIVFLGANKFTNNQATNTGGAIDNSIGAVEEFFDSFSGNHAPDGGAVYNTANGINDNVFFGVEDTFTNNHAGYGGAVENNGSLEFFGTTFNQNKADNDGGAIWNLNGSLELNTSAVSNNTAGTTGGGVSLYSGSDGDIEQTTFNGNHATQSGGGIYNEDQLKLYNSTFSSNRSDADGGGVYTTIGEVTAYNDTIAENTASAGAGIYRANGNLDLQNTVLSNNTGGNCGGTVPSNGTNISSDNTCTGFTKTGDHQNTNASLNPAALNGGFGLTYLPQPASPLINNGTDLDDIDQDERGVSRPQAGDTDIGAVEVCYFTKPPAPTLEEPGQNATVKDILFIFQWTGSGCYAYSQITVRQNSKTGKSVLQSNYVAGGYYYAGKTLAAGTYVWQVKACNEFACTASKWQTFKVKGTTAAAAEDETVTLPDIATVKKLFTH